MQLILFLQCKTHDEAITIWLSILEQMQIIIYLLFFTHLTKACGQMDGMGEGATDELKDGRVDR